MPLLGSAYSGGTLASVNITTGYALYIHPSQGQVSYLLP